VAHGGAGREAQNRSRFCSGARGRRGRSAPSCAPADPDRHQLRHERGTVAVVQQVAFPVLLCPIWAFNVVRLTTHGAKGDPGLLQHIRAELDSESSLSSDSVMLREGVLILSLRSEDSARRAGARASRACAGGGAAARWGNTRSCTVSDGYSLPGGRRARLHPSRTQDSHGVNDLNDAAAGPALAGPPRHSG
jgi:hypothetical protein